MPKNTNVRLSIVTIVSTIITIAILLLTISPGYTSDNQQDKTLNAIYKHYGQSYDLDWKLIKAVATVESDERPQAINRSDPSYGLMQILCRPSEDTQKCANCLYNVDPWPATKEQLLDPRINVKIGAQILKWNIEQYGFERGIAVYNSRSAAATNKQPLPNRGYVDKVMKVYRRISNGQTKEN